MKKAKIFLVGENGEKLVPMEESPYEAEDILQRLLSNYPDLIPGDQINPDQPRRWLLVKREAGIPSSQEGGDVWSIDHLFLDQDGMPTFVECKRAADTRIRREVVAQMLEYAANGTKYWPMERLRQDAAETANQSGRDLDELLAEIVGVEGTEDLENYWNVVESNLRESRIRLVFVADEIPRELQRLIEFLNEKMADIEVIGVEIKQYLGGTKKAVVPRLVGLTEKARQRKESTPAKPTNAEAFLEELPDQCRDFFKSLFTVTKERNLIIQWGTRGFSLRIKFKTDQRVRTFAYGWPNGDFSFYSEYLSLSSLSEEAIKTFREDLLSFGLLKETGKHTLMVKIDQSNSGKALEILNFMIDRMKEIVNTSP